MQTQIIKLINDFENGRMSRRQLIAHLTGMFAATVGATIAFADQQTQLAAPSPWENYLRPSADVARPRFRRRTIFQAETCSLERSAHACGQA
jgi:hypothetical protein